MPATITFIKIMAYVEAEGVSLACQVVAPHHCRGAVFITRQHFANTGLEGIGTNGYLSDR